MISTPAVLIGINRILVASVEKHGNNASFSGWVQSIIKPSLVDRCAGLFSKCRCCLGICPRLDPTATGAGLPTQIGRWCT